jgi:hypothetical protein
VPRAMVACCRLAGRMMDRSGKRPKGHAGDRPLPISARPHCASSEGADRRRKPRSAWPAGNSWSRRALPW